MRPNGFEVLLRLANKVYHTLGLHLRGQARAGMGGRDHTHETASQQEVYHTLGPRL